MKSFQEIKQELYTVTIEHPGRESKYGLFLDRLAEHDRRGDQEAWDLWYFSINTDFCRSSATYFLEEIRGQLRARGRPEDGAAIGQLGFLSLDRVRMFHGCLCLYLYAAMESFAHEINLFYELNLKRHAVSLTAVHGQLAKERNHSALSKHLQESLYSPVVTAFRNYRHAIVHGYVYPIYGQEDRIGIGSAPRAAPFSFQGQYIDILDFCERSHTSVNHLICHGWRCFEQDELTEPAPGQ